MTVLERFLNYVSYDTQSSEESDTFPSTEKQKRFLCSPFAPISFPVRIRTLDHNTRRHTDFQNVL